MCTSTFPLHLAGVALVLLFATASTAEPVLGFKNCLNDDSNCLNGGVCEAHPQLLGLYSCRCADGFRGPSCETPFVPCGDHFCANGGSCSADFTCDCPSNFIGSTCEDPIEPCPFDGIEDAFCMNGGTCAWVHGNARCQCPEGFAGPQCEDEVLECRAPHWCVRGHGVCTSDDRSQCFCYDSWTGEHCETSVAAVRNSRTVAISVGVACAMLVLVLMLGGGVYLMIRREKQGNPLFQPLLEESNSVGDVEMRRDSASSLKPAHTPEAHNQKPEAGSS